MRMSRRVLIVSFPARRSLSPHFSCITHLRGGTKFWSEVRLLDVQPTPVCRESCVGVVGLRFVGILCLSAFLTVSRTLAWPFWLVRGCLHFAFSVMKISTVESYTTPVATLSVMSMTAFSAVVLTDTLCRWFASCVIHSHFQKHRTDVDNAGVKMLLLCHAQLLSASCTDGLPVRYSERSAEGDKVVSTDGFLNFVGCGWVYSVHMLAKVWSSP